MLTNKELRKKSLKDLQKELIQAREDSIKAQIPVRMGQDKQATEAKKKQRYVAQVLTVMNDPQHSGKEEATPEETN